MILEDAMSKLKLREYDENAMSEELKDKLLNYYPPMLFREMIYPEEDQAELEVRYLLDINEDGALYTPWVSVPVFAVEVVGTAEEEVDRGGLH